MVHGSCADASVLGPECAVLTSEEYGAAPYSSVSEHYTLISFLPYTKLPHVLRQKLQHVQPNKRITPSNLTPIVQ